ncbi:hypothetical protein Tdes44962_MAKER09976 [Teratosphaeria destructans]|uniref:Uncharacterized protein n=1 Tax=Teratosphaeria destructans TaxID=418781 RepID=A0A9W7SQ93_9PEZI|nr:hypothetical protein Tdes44962_MAKER09976 [Teratosphaeria destructans]
MFAMTGLDLPYRHRKHGSRASSVRGFSRRRHGVSPTPTPDQHLWMPMMSPALWHREFLGRGATPTPGTSGSQRPDAMPCARAMRSPTEQRDGGSDGRYGRSAGHRGAYGPREAVPFDQAADALRQALHVAMKHCQNIRERFDHEVVDSTIASWVPPKFVDALWSMNLDWDGIDARDAEQAHHAQRTPDTAVTYNDVMTNLFKALDALKTTGRPRVEYPGEAESKLDVFRNAMKKLQRTMSGVEGLSTSVRFDRALMERLVKDMTAAEALVGDVQDSWRRARTHRAAEKARARWADEEDVWAEYE